MTIADIGAGSGYYVVRLTPIVGPSGRIFAEDVVLPSVKSYQLPDLESETPANWQLDLPGMVVAAGDSLQI